MSHKQIGILCPLQLLIPNTDEKKKQRKGQQKPIFMAEPMRASNSFVGTEEYIAPVCALLNLYFLFFFNEINFKVYSYGCCICLPEKRHILLIIYI